MGHDWRAKFDEAHAISTSDRGTTPADARKCELMDQHFQHPIYDLFRLVEEHTGIARETLEQVAWRLNTRLGGAPLNRAPNPRNFDPAFVGFLDAERPDLPDLRPVYARLRECDLNGTTATILKRFDEKHPGLLTAFGLDLQPGENTQPNSPADEYYRPLSQLQAENQERFPTMKSARTFLDKHPRIRRRRPTTKRGSEHPQRIEVNHGDWHACLKQESERPANEPEDAPADAADAILAAHEQKHARRGDLR
jgi:hypothetical protein